MRVRYGLEPEMLQEAQSAILRSARMAVPIRHQPEPLQENCRLDWMRR